MAEKEWDEDIPAERHPKLNDAMKTKGEKKILQIVSDKPKPVSQTILEKARKKNDQELDFPARESFILNFKEQEDMWEFWFSTTAYSVLRDLKKVKEANNGTLENAWITLERVAVGDRTKANWKIEPVTNQADVSG